MMSCPKKGPGAGVLHAHNQAALAAGLGSSPGSSFLELSRASRTPPRQQPAPAAGPRQQPGSAAFAATTAGVAEEAYSRRATGARQALHSHAGGAWGPTERHEGRCESRRAEEALGDSFERALTEVRPGRHRHRDLSVRTAMLCHGVPSWLLHPRRHPGTSAAHWTSVHQHRDPGTLHLGLGPGRTRAATEGKVSPPHPPSAGPGLATAPTPHRHLAQWSPPAAAGTPRLMTWPRPHQGRARLGPGRRLPRAGAVGRLGPATRL